MKEDKSFQIELGDIAVKLKLGIESIESLMKMSKFISQKYSENVSNDSRK